jgi:hypothetical protein
MFEYTPEGYEKAVEYLKEIGKYELIENELSRDGYTTVRLANEFKEKENEAV